MNRIQKIVGTTMAVVLAISATSAMADNDKIKDQEKKDKDDKHQVVSVPEPATLLLFATGVAAVGVGAFMRRRKK